MQEQFLATPAMFGWLGLVTGDRNWSYSLSAGLSRVTMESRTAPPPSWGTCSKHEALFVKGVQ